MYECVRERVEQRGLASDGIQMATDIIHNNLLKVHSGTHDYNFRRIHFDTLGCHI